ncbi:MAG: alanine racemase [Ruminococcaceae bacterium]|nr:alanine racemase [Oscillospiraceae bacterium]
MDFLHRTWAEIDISALKHNFNLFKKHAKNSKIMAVVKANAYGHSAKDIAPVLEQCGAHYFAVSNIEEALSLRSFGIKKPILILGYTPVNKAKELSVNNLSQCVYSLEYANELSKNAKEQNVNIKIYIKLDTGMSRIGFDCRNDNFCGISDAVTAAKLDNFVLEGVFTHFAVSDRTPENEDGFTNEQFARFQKGIELLSKNGVNPPLKSCCNSAGFLQDTDKHLSYSRVGIALYGLSPASDLKVDLPLIPVMTVKSVVSQVKEIIKGDTVNYGRTFKATNNMKIATVSAGYADGYPRILSNKGYVLINGKKANIIGRICMDQMCVDVTDIPVKMGDEVILFGKELSVDVLADLSGTINYEIVCGISSRVPRIIING